MGAGPLIPPPPPRIPVVPGDAAGACPALMGFAENTINSYHYWVSLNNLLLHNDIRYETKLTTAKTF